MRPVWIVLGIFVAFALVCGVGGVFLGSNLYREGVKNDAEAKSWAKSALLEVGDQWDPKVLDRYASPVLHRVSDEKDEAKYLGWFKRKLGRLKQVGEFSTKGVRFRSDNGVARAVYALGVHATFDKGVGQINLTVAKSNGQWQIDELRIDSDALLQ